MKSLTVVLTSMELYPGIQEERKPALTFEVLALTLGTPAALLTALSFQPWPTTSLPTYLQLSSGSVALAKGSTDGEIDEEVWGDPQVSRRHHAELTWAS